MSNTFKTHDILLVTERIRRVLKNGGIGSDPFIQDVTTLVDALKGVKEIIFKEEGDE